MFNIANCCLTQNKQLCWLLWTNPNEMKTASRISGSDAQRKDSAIIRKCTEKRASLKTRNIRIRRKTRIHWPLKPPGTNGTISIQNGNTDRTLIAVTVVFKSWCFTVLMIRARDFWMGHFIPANLGMGLGPDGRVVGALPPPSLVNSGWHSGKKTLMISGSWLEMFENGNWGSMRNFETDLMVIVGCRG